MPPRQVAPPTRILLVRSQKEYRELLGKSRAYVSQSRVLRPRPPRNRLLLRPGTLWRKSWSRQPAPTSANLANDCGGEDRKLDREYRGNIPQTLLKPLTQKIAALDDADRANERQFEDNTKRFFETLYHEACHAYVGSFVYAKTDKMPSWLQEGLAQIFETAILDGMEFRVGHLDLARVERVRNASRRGELPGLIGLLHAGPRQFIANHTQEKAATDCYYLTAWALAHYLVFDREMLGTPELDRYVAALAAGADPIAAFEQLVGESPANFVKSMPADLRLQLEKGENSSLIGDRRP